MESAADNRKNALGSESIYGVKGMFRSNSSHQRRS